MNKNSTPEPAPSQRETDPQSVEPTQPADPGPAKPKKKGRKKRFRWLRITLAVFFAVIFVVSAVNIVIYIQQGREARENQTQTLQTYVALPTDDRQEQPQSTDPTANAGSDPQSPEQEPMPDVEALRYRVDFGGMKAVNPDVSAWVTVPALPTVNFPVLWRENDDYWYLHRGWEGDSKWYGSIFLEGMNLPDFLDSHCIVYGHNMMDGSMFGTLESFEEEEFYRQNSPYIVIHTPGHAMLYEIFSVEYVSGYDDQIYRVAFYDGEDYQQFLQGMKERSLYDTGVEVSGSDRIITLSTCAYIFQGSRFVVHGKLVWSN